MKLFVFLLLISVSLNAFADQNFCTVLSLGVGQVGLSEYRPLSPGDLSATANLKLGYGVDLPEKHKDPASIKEAYCLEFSGHYGQSTVRPEIANARRYQDFSIIGRHLSETKENERKLKDQHEIILTSQGRATLRKSLNLISGLYYDISTLREFEPGSGIYFGVKSTMGIPYPDNYLIHVSTGPQVAVDKKIDLPKTDATLNLRSAIALLGTTGWKIDYGLFGAGTIVGEASIGINKSVSDEPDEKKLITNIYAQTRAQASATIDSIDGTDPYASGEMLFIDAGVEFR